MASCGKLTSIIILVFLNSIFMLTGLGLIGCGVWIRIASKDYNTIMGSNGLETPANLILAAGAAIFLVACFGFCGAYRESKCLLLLYLIALVVIILLEIGCVVTAFIFKDKAKEYITTGVTKAIQETYGKQGHVAITLAVDSVQEKMKCCGASGYLDYNQTPWYIEAKKINNRTRPYPTSCIDPGKQNHTVALNDTRNANIAYDQGCISALEEAANDQLLISGGIAASILFIEILGFIAGISLFRNLKASASPI